VRVVKIGGTPMLGLLWLLAFLLGGSAAFGDMASSDATTITDYLNRLQCAHDFEFHDPGDVFDEYYAAIPVLTRDITDPTVLVDEVYLCDPGNEIVARELSGINR
jgi:hypothetical protein